MSALPQPSPGIDWDRVLAESFVRRTDLHASLPSTNDRGLELAVRPGLVCPLLIAAQRQTAGRGRGGNRWWSAEGALTFSLVVDCRQFRLTPMNRPRVSLTVGLALCDMLGELLSGVHIGLKWPNDVLLGGKKTSGILIEAPPASDRLVIGVGLNVNNSLEGAPGPVGRVATSLADAAGTRFDLNDVLIPLLRQIEQGLEKLTAAPGELSERWRQYCVLCGRSVTLDVNDRYVAGLCQGIDADGALVLKTGNGLKRFFSGVVAGIG